MTVNWTQKQFDEMLNKNPALRIDEQHSQPARAGPKKPKRPKIQPPPLKFYEIERPIKLFIPFVPPSLNRILAMNQWERRKLKEEFVNDMRWELMVNKVKCFRSSVIIIITIFHPVVRRRDPDNYQKWLLDSLKGVLIVDDSPEYLAEPVRVDFRKGKKHMEIRVIPVAKEVSA
jgi:Holliday junction resolvase RusA-like endonuclease